MGKSSSVTIGYKYYVGMHMICCHGPVDRVRRIVVGERVAWEGTVTSSSQIYIDRPDLFGGKKREGGIQGAVDLMFGEADQDRNDYLQLHTDPEVPAFRGLFSIVLRQCLVSMMNPYIKPWKPEVTRWPKGWYEEKAAIGTRDANPAHVIVECLTNAEWGLGYSFADLALTSFAAAADTLYNEGFGMSLLWDRQSKVQDFIQSILQHIDAALFVDPATGLFTLKLIRNDYLPSSLPLFTQDEIISIDNFSRATPSDMPNTLTLRYVDRDGKTQSVTVHDIGSLEQTGQTVSTNVDMPGIPTKELAIKVAMREIGQLARPLAKVTLNITRAASNVRVGDAIRITSPDHAMNQQIMRVMSISYGTLRDGSIRMELLEDAFSLPQYSFTVGQDGLWEPPYTDPEAVPDESRAIIEAPFYQIVRALTGDSAASQAQLDPLGGVLMVGAADLPGDVMSFDVYTRQDTVAFEEEVTGDPTPSGTLAAALNLTSTSITIENGDRLDEIDLPIVISPYTPPANPEIWAIIDPGTANEEIIGIDTLNLSTGAATIIRGALDTVPHTHAAGARVFFLQDGAALSTLQYLQGEVVDIKILPMTANGLLDVASAPTNSKTFTGRATRPYPPGNFRLNGTRYPTTISGALTVAWAHRNRLAQTAYIVEQTEGNIGPEPSATYTLRLYDQTNTLRRTVTGLTGTSYTWLTESIDSGLTAGADASLLHFDGANGSTTFTDENGWSWTRGGDAVISTAQSVFGGSSLLLDGSGDFLRQSDASKALSIRSGYLTFECRVRMSSYASSPRYLIRVGGEGSTYTAGWIVGVSGASPVIFAQFGTGASEVTVAGSTVLSLNTWYHVAVVYTPTGARIYVNGSLEGTSTGAPSDFTGSQFANIGRDPNTTARNFHGHIDELRISASERYTANFTPAGSAHTYDPPVLNTSVRAVLTTDVGGRESHQAQDWTVARV